MKNCFQHGKIRALFKAIQKVEKEMRLIAGATDLKVHAKTVAAQHDTGEWTNLKELLDYQQEAFSQLKRIIEKQTEEDWQQTVTTKEFGTKTKAEAMGRIISHTAYHAGQLVIILKYA
jgi:uncharacterized damage-inducible protein DinB